MLTPTRQHPLILPLPGDQLFKSMSLWRPFWFKRKKLLSRAGCMSSSKWPTENKLNGISEGCNEIFPFVSFSQNFILSLIFNWILLIYWGFFLSLFTLKVLCKYIITSSFVVFIGLLSVRIHESLYLYLFPVALLWPFSQWVFVSSYSDVRFYLIILYYYRLQTCFFFGFWFFFSSERQRGVDLDGRGGGKELEGVKGEL